VPRPVLHLIAWFSLLVALTWGAAAMDLVAIPVQDVPGSRMLAQPIPAVLALPNGKGPFPAVIVLHGSAGGGRGSGSGPNV
jgi:hypothetical protein